MASITMPIKTRDAGSGTAAAAPAAAVWPKTGPPERVIGGVDAAIKIAVGRQAPAGLAHRVTPHDVVGRVDRAVAIIVAGNWGRIAPGQRWQLVQRDDVVVVQKRLHLLGA